MKRGIEEEGGESKEVTYICVHVTCIWEKII